ncbi:protein brambleberry-like [Phaenicophaeus curvirostris]|uniref:protein brambleberry-like n=1 Tax=Phaenicophaeus curvirostris TaxID=33595 RepID=UPI0037F0F08B
MGTPPEKLRVPTELGLSTQIPFEVTVVDERFQAEATRWEPSTLDSGHHQEQPAGRLRPGLETPSLLWPALDEALIAGGQRQVVQLIEDITQRTGNASGHGTLRLQEGPRANLSNLQHMQERAWDVYSQLESNLALLLAQQHQMEEVMEKLWQMNQSLGLALLAVEDARNQVEKHLQHLQRVQDPTGQSPNVISTCILHGSYFVLLVSLLVPMLPRAILLLLFLASSVLAELLGISALFALLVLALAGKWLFVTTSRGAGGACLVVPPEKPRTWLTSTPEREHELELLQVELDKMEMSYLQEPSCLKQPPAVAGDVPSLAGRVSSICGGWRTKLRCGEMLDMTTGSEKPKPYSPSRSLTSDVSLRSRCQGLTRAGQPCRKKANPGQDFCYVHTTS